MMMDYLAYMMFRLVVKDDFRCTALASLGVDDKDIYYLRGIIADGKGGLAFSDKADLKRFSQITTNSDCIVGANTLKTMGHVRNRGRRWILPNGDYERYRELLKDESLSDDIKDSLWMIHDGDVSYRDWKDLELDIMRSNVYVIGGPTTYQKLHEHINQLDLTYWDVRLHEGSLHGAQRFEFGPFDYEQVIYREYIPLHGHEDYVDPLTVLMNNPPDMSFNIGHLLHGYHPELEVRQYIVTPKKGHYKDIVHKTNVIRRVK